MEGAGWAPIFTRIDINTRKLRHFVVVAEELHFSRAATSLYLTQQALSAEIKEIEAWTVDIGSPGRAFALPGFVHRPLHLENIVDT